MKISLEENLENCADLPVFDETIFYPEIKKRELGITDDDMKHPVEYFIWQLEQRNPRDDQQRVIAILKSRMEKLIHQKKVEPSRDLEAFQSLHPAGIEKFESDQAAVPHLF